MLNKLRGRISALFVRVPPEIEASFLADCAKKNNFRLYALSGLTAISQLFSYLVYQYVYPIWLPAREPIEPVSYAILSGVYFLLCLIFCMYFRDLHRAADTEKDEAVFTKKSRRAAIAFMLLYIAFEGLIAFIELRTSNNIYRLLASLFIVAYLPLLGRGFSHFLVILHAVCIELGFITLVGLGYRDSNGFGQMMIVFFFICLTVTNFANNAAIRAFFMRHSLESLNEQLREANSRLEKLAVLDPLTQTSNRWALEQYMPLAWRSAFSSGRYISVIMIDVDDFKIFNDTYGHQMGDKCLAAVAACIKNRFTRETDMVARYGGEEFIVISIHEGPEKVLAHAEALLDDIRALGLENRGGCTGGIVTVSMGHAIAIPADGISVHDLIKAADDALYVAKASGKDRLKTA